MSVSEEQLKEAMDSYGNLRHHIEMLESNLQTVKDKVLEKYPDAKRELMEAEEELQPEIDKVKEQEKFFKKILDSMLLDFAKEAPIQDKLILNSKLMSVTMTKGKVTYDPKIIDGFVMGGHKELLSARTEEAPSTRLTMRKL